MPCSILPTANPELLGGQSLTRAPLVPDFVRGEDKIDLHAIDANTLTSTNDAFTWIGSDTSTKNAGELRIASIAGGHQVQADVNGDEKVDFAIDGMTKMVL